MLRVHPFATALAGLTRRLRGDAASAAAVSAYQRQARPYLLKALAAYDRWLSVSRDLGASDLLANAASVQRWEFLSWHEQLAELLPPGEIEHLHLRVMRGFRDAARASQLLALGYRSTTYATVCDGQTLLSDSTDCLRRALQQFKRVEPSQDFEAATLERRAS